MDQPVIVIGLGNPLRGDDGIGPEVIKQLEATLSPLLRDKVALMTQYQVDVVQAAVLKDYKAVVFVDAGAGHDSPAVQISKISAGAGTPAFTSHIGSIPELLFITERIFGGAPVCYLATVKGKEFDFKEGLSAAAASNSIQAAAEIRRLLSET